jgi:flagellin
MSITLNSNNAATKAAFNLSKASDSLRKSLARLSSGNRIVDSNDDPGGMSVAYKLNSRMRRTEAVRSNVQNGISFLQVQDGALQSAGTIVNRMAELRAMAQDVTKNASDAENYTKEFVELQKQLSQLYREKFNDVSLFAVSDSEEELPPDRPALYKGVEVDEDGNNQIKFSRRLFTHDSGQASDGNVSLGIVNFESVFKLGQLDSRYISNFSGSLVNLSNANSINSTKYPTSGSSENSEVFTESGFISSILFVSMGQFTSVIERIADARAENGAEQNRLLKIDGLLSSNLTNLEAAHGRIMDADIALESARFAQQNVLVQASAAMVAQANQISSIALTILGR